MNSSLEDNGTLLVASLIPGKNMLLLPSNALNCSAEPVDPEECVLFHKVIQDYRNTKDPTRVKYITQYLKVSSVINEMNSSMSMFHEVASCPSSLDFILIATEKPVENGHVITAYSGKYMSATCY